VTVAELTRKDPTGFPITAKEDGNCPLCPEQIRGGIDFISKVEPIGWGHTHCINGYCRAVNDNLPDEDDVATGRFAGEGQS
jgi:hypothetical protein